MLLKKLLFQTKKQGVLAVALGGSMLGMAFLLLAINFYFNINKWMRSEDGVFGSNSIVIQKRITELNTLSISNSSFTPDEIEEIQSLKFVEDLAAFENNTFDVSLKMADQGDMPYFRTDMFLQSLPEKYFDIDGNEWHWDENSEIVPIIMPEDYLTLYNHGFAPAQGLPQISKKTFSSALFELEVKGEKDQKKYLARVVHLSNKINSILVPQSFLHFANENYGTGQQKDPSRLIISAKEDQFAALEQFVEDRNLDVNKSVINYAKIKSYVKILLIVVLLIGLIILILSFNNLILYSMQIIVKTEYEIKTLLRIGYSVEMISKQYLNYFIKVFGIITVLAIGVVLLSNSLINIYIEKFGFEIDIIPHWIAWLSAMIIFGLFIVLNKINIQKNILVLGD